MNISIKSRGQSLVEVVVSLAVTIIIIMAIIALVLNSLKNAQFAQNQAKATKYAQQAIDALRVVRDRNLPVGMSAGSQAFSKFFSEVGYINCVPTNAVPICHFTIDPASLSLTQGGATSKRDLGGGFAQQIVIETILDGTRPSSIKVIANIYWTDSGGAHQSSLVTLLVDK